MKATLFRGAAFAMVILAVAAPSALAADDDVVPFRRLHEFEKEFIAKVGTSVVKAARLSPKKIELKEYKFEEVKDRKDRKDLKITMTWVGLTKKTYTSTIVIKLDTSDDKKWEVLNVEYKDDAAGKPSQNKIQDLIDKFNR